MVNGELIDEIEEKNLDDCTLVVVTTTGRDRDLVAGIGSAVLVKGNLQLNVFAGNSTREVK